MQDPIFIQLQQPGPSSGAQRPEPYQECSTQWPNRRLEAQSAESTASVVPASCTIWTGEACNEASSQPVGAVAFRPIAMLHPSVQYRAVASQPQLIVHDHLSNVSSLNRVRAESRQSVPRSVQPSHGAIIRSSPQPTIGRCLLEGTRGPANANAVHVVGLTAQSMVENGRALCVLATGSAALAAKQ